MIVTTGCSYMTQPISSPSRRPMLSHSSVSSPRKRKLSPLLTFALKFINVFQTDITLDWRHRQTFLLFMYYSAVHNHNPS